MKDTTGTVSTHLRKIIETEVRTTPLTQIYMNGHFHVLVQALP